LLPYFRFLLLNNNEFSKISNIAANSQHHNDNEVEELHLERQERPVNILVLNIWTGPDQYNIFFSYFLMTLHYLTSVETMIL
jgi:hypothetical protein